jgi:hypothetical protein
MLIQMGSAAELLRFTKEEKALWGKHFPFAQN